MLKRIIASLSAVVLAVSLVPLPAFAGDASLTAGDLGAQEPAELQTQAKGGAYVLVKATVEHDHGSGTSSLEETTYSYKGGLLASSTRRSKRDGEEWSGGTTTTYSYQGTAVKGSALGGSDGGSASMTVSYAMGEDGKWAKAVLTYYFGSADSVEGALSYDGGGRLSKCKQKTTYHDAWGNSGATSSTRLFKYDKAGRVSKIISKSKGTYGRKSTSTYRYDNRGNLRKTQGDSTTYNYANTYRDGLLVKRVKTSSSPTSVNTYTATTTYRYKKVAVDANAASAVEAQQWALLNDNLNSALSVWGM